MLSEAQHRKEYRWELPGIATRRGNRETELGSQRKEWPLVRWEAGMFETILQSLLR